MLTFRSSKIVYYGPHACENCGAAIVRMAMAFGGNAFDQPYGPIYPNTEWHIHVCDPGRLVNRLNPTMRSLEPVTVRLSDEPAIGGQAPPEPPPERSIRKP